MKFGLAQIIMIALISSFAFSQDEPLQNRPIKEKNLYNRSVDPKSMASNPSRAVLRLSGEQRGNIERLRRDLRKENIPLQNLIQLKCLELEELLDQVDPDVLEMEGIVKEIGDLNAQLRINYLQAQLRIRKELTEEQMAALKQRGFGIGVCKQPPARPELDP